MSRVNELNTSFQMFVPQTKIELDMSFAIALGWRLWGCFASHEGMYSKCSDKGGSHWRKLSVGKQQLM